MERVTAGRERPLHDTAGVRTIEARAAAALPPHTLMQRAGLAVARLALAIAPHARRIWIACGPGNNGGDGFEAAIHLKAWGKEVVLTFAGDAARQPPDAARSRERAAEAGIGIATAPPAQWDLAIDALLGIGTTRPLAGAVRDQVLRMNAAGAPVLAVDVPSGLDADTGHAELAVAATHTLTLIAAKPGLFTAQGRDATGTPWLDPLAVDTSLAEPVARLAGAPTPRTRPHASHKGSWGDVLVVGGAPGMAGAALLAARAALHHGAGRVFVGLLDPVGLSVDQAQPDLMLRDWRQLDPSALAVACGCGGGDAVREALPALLSRSRALVLDADALNAVAGDASLQALLTARGARHLATVLTPHPLEAARLLGTDARTVQRDRLSAARSLATRFDAVTVLKGSGTVIAAPDEVPWINPTGNARLAVAGTGDVLAGMVAARLAAGQGAVEATKAAVYEHGLAADRWPAGEALTANALAARA